MSHHRRNQRCTFTKSARAKTNEGQVALEMGNSPKIVKDRYFEIVDGEAAEKYWSLKPLPEHNRKIVALTG